MNNFLNNTINSPRSTKYMLIAYTLAIFVVSGLHLKTSSHGFVAKDKIMHLAEFFMLGLLMIRYFAHSKKFNIKKSILYTLIFGTLFAISDEIHQGFVGYFSSGIFGGVRDPSMFDVFADIIGVSMAVYIYSIISIRYTKQKLNGKLNESI
ncbi:MAG: VanZ family protein [Candidatus Delongbacteria bacterium]|nr:VanZ family protein [Candidatus Delongbacteria bacterium]